MKCDKCGREVSPEDIFTHAGQQLCEDCYMDSLQPVKACDPWAVYLAGRARETAGAGEAADLTDLQREIYDFVKERRRVIPETVMERFSLSQAELQTQVAVLRHCELVRGTKEGNRVFLAPFSEPEDG